MEHKEKWTEEKYQDTSVNNYYSTNTRNNKLSENA